MDIRRRKTFSCNENCEKFKNFSKESCQPKAKPAFVILSNITPIIIAAIRKCPCQPIFRTIFISGVPKTSPISSSKVDRSVSSSHLPSTTINETFAVVQLILNDRFVTKKKKKIRVALLTRNSD